MSSKDSTSAVPGSVFYKYVSTMLSGDDVGITSFFK